MQAGKIILVGGIPGALGENEKHEFLTSRITGQPGLKTSNEIRVGINGYFMEFTCQEAKDDRKRKYGTKDYRRRGVADFQINEKDIIALYLVEGDDIVNPVIEKIEEEEEEEEEEPAKEGEDKADGEPMQDGEMDPDTMTVKELRRALEARGLYKKGLKAELQERLKEYLEEQANEKKEAEQGAMVLINDEAELEAAQEEAQQEDGGDGEDDAPKEEDKAPEPAAEEAPAQAEEAAGDAAPTPAEMNAPAPTEATLSPDDIDKMKLPKLREAIKSRGGTTNGKKSDLQNRLKELLAAELEETAKTQEAGDDAEEAAEPAEPEKEDETMKEAEPAAGPEAAAEEETPTPAAEPAAEEAVAAPAAEAAPTDNAEQPEPTAEAQDGKDGKMEVDAAGGDEKTQESNEAADPTAAVVPEEVTVVDVDEPAHPYRLVIALKRNPRQRSGQSGRDSRLRRDEDILPNEVLKKTRIIVVEFTVQGGMGVDPRQIFRKLLEKGQPLFGMNQKESFTEGDNDFKSVVTRALAASDEYIAQERKYWDATSLVQDNKRLNKEVVSLEKQVARWKEKAKTLKENLGKIKAAHTECVKLL